MILDMQRAVKEIVAEMKRQEHRAFPIRPLLELRVRPWLALAIADDIRQKSGDSREVFTKLCVRGYPLVEDATLEGDWAIVPVTAKAS